MIGRNMGAGQLHELHQKQISTLRKKGLAKRVQYTYKRTKILDYKELEMSWRSTQNAKPHKHHP